MLKRSIRSGISIRDQLPDLLLDPNLPVQIPLEESVARIVSERQMNPAGELFTRYRNWIECLKRRDTRDVPHQVHVRNYSHVRRVVITRVSIIVNSHGTERESRSERPVQVYSHCERSHRRRLTFKVQFISRCVQIHVSWTWRIQSLTENIWTSDARLESWKRDTRKETFSPGIDRFPVWRNPNISVARNSSSGCSSVVAALIRPSQTELLILISQILHFDSLLSIFLNGASDKEILKKFKHHRFASRVKQWGHYRYFV